MIEITETEPEDEIERFIESMLIIYEEIHIKPEILNNSPHTIEDMIDWKYDYTINEACFTLGEKQKDTKFWPNRNRIDNIYGDKNITKLL